jgi:Fe-S cluster biogenesis protein NfuA
VKDEFYGRIESVLFPGGERMREKVEATLARIRPALQADGGDIELVDVTGDGIVKVRLQGSCAGCPMSQMTLKNYVEEAIKEAVPEVKAVEAVM